MACQAVGLIALRSGDRVRQWRILHAYKRVKNLLFSLRVRVPHRRASTAQLLSIIRKPKRNNPQTLHRLFICKTVTFYSSQGIIDTPLFI